MKNLLVAQSGGPTAAINATVVGVFMEASLSGKVDKIYGAIHGIQGVFEETFVDLKEALKTTEDLQILAQTPAAALGSCRLKLKEEKQFEQIIEIFRKYEIGYFVYIGGNDSMDTVDKLSAYCKKKGIEDIQVVGAPKTIDNDLVATDHCPGFGSAAKYIATTFAELERDCHVYSTKAVTLVEVMGRDAGWLTAASALARENGGAGPDLIYLCEPAFDQESFLEDIKLCLEKKDAVLVAFSEGIKDSQGIYISEQVQNDQVDAFGHKIIAGAAKVLENLVRENIGCKVRSIELNLMQRCAGHLASARDIEESKMLGMKACRCALNKESGHMASIKRSLNSPYTIEITSVLVSEVANHVKRVPKEFINVKGNDVSQMMVDYLRPLIEGEIRLVYENGLPKHLHFYK